jgi:small subunit ribosomal protein S17
VNEQRKRLKGRVLSNKMDKTVVVRVERTFRHPRYGKVLLRAKRYKAHDADGRCQVGDLVQIVESRPLSREKRWVVEAIIGSDASAELSTEVTQ